MKKIRTRLILSHLLPLLVILPVVGLLLNSLLKTQVLVAGVSNELIRQAVLVADLTVSSLEIWQDTAQAQIFVQRISPRLTAKLMLLDPQGHLMVSSDPNDLRFVGRVYEMPDLERLLAMETPVEVRYKQSQIADVIVPAVTRNGQVIGFVRLANPLADVYAQSEQLGRVILYVVGGGLLGGILLGWLLARELENPLHNASLAAYRLGSDPHSVELLEEQGPEEVRMFARAYNLLVERLRTSEETRRRLQANMVHELGRPLGAMLSALQALRRGADEEPALRGELLKGMETEVVRLQHLLDDVSQLREREGGKIELNRQPIQLAEWIPLVLRTWHEAALEKKQQWEINIPDNLPPVSIDPDRLAQALGNLVSNAVYYTPDGGAICIEVSAGLQEIQIRVKDNGPGIAPEEQARIFDAFYRGKAARRFSDGMGLGLTITRDLIQAHHGSLELTSAPGSGACFTIRLPLN